MKTILLPTDFSNNALMAAEFAISKLVKGPAKLTLFNVYDIPRGGTSGLFYLMDELQKQAKNDIEEFKHILEEKYTNNQLQFDARIAQGDFAERCTLMAEELNADCIVMGTKGSSGIKDILIGSSTIDLMKRLKRPLYVVPENFQEAEIKEIIVSVDGKEIGDQAKQEILNYSIQHNLPIQLLHIRLNDDNPIQDWEKLKTYFKDIKLELHEAYADNLEEGLKKSTENSKALLVMIKRKQSFWERFFNLSDSQKAVMSANLPMLILPEVD